jgi:hypothetical protein
MPDGRSIATSCWARPTATAGTHPGKVLVSLPSTEGQKPRSPSGCATPVEGFGAGITSLTVELTDGTTQVEGETYFGAIGDLAEIVVRAEVSSLSGLPIITTFLPSELSSDVSFRLERNSEAWDTTLVPIDAGVLC